MFCGMCERWDSWRSPQRSCRLLFSGLSRGVNWYPFTDVPGPTGCTEMPVNNYSSVLNNRHSVRISGNKFYSQNIERGNHPWISRRNWGIILMRVTDSVRACVWGCDLAHTSDYSPAYCKCVTSGAVQTNLFRLCRTELGGWSTVTQSAK